MEKGYERIKNKDDKLAELKALKSEFEKNEDFLNSEYIRATANINYIGGCNVNYTDISIYFEWGFSIAYKGILNFEIYEEITKAFKMMEKDSYKGYCLLLAIMDAVYKKMEVRKK